MHYVYLKLSDLKNRARRISRENDIPHQQALDLAALRGGYQNYAHALQFLPNGNVHDRFTVEIRQRWREREPRRWGDASFSLALGSPLDDLLRLHHLVGYFGGCEIEGPATLVSNSIMRNINETQNDIGKLARALQFIDGTRLRPSRAKRIYPKGSWHNRPPIADHDHGWYDTEARVHILSTEPYRDDATKAPEQLAWEDKWGWATLPVAWGSIYGFGTRLYLLCPKAYLSKLREKITRLETGPQAINTDEIEISGHPDDR